MTETWAKTHAVTLSKKTAKHYASLYDLHPEQYLGELELTELSPEVIGRWQADRIAPRAGRVAVLQALDLLGSILQRAAEGGRLSRNPVRLVRKIARPLGTQAGDVMLAAIYADADSTIGAPTGWTLVPGSEVASENAGMALAVYYRVATAGEPATVTFTLGTAGVHQGGITSYRNVDTGTAPAAQTTQESLQTPSVTPSTYGSVASSFAGSLVYDSSSGELSADNQDWAEQPADAYDWSSVSLTSGPRLRPSRRPGRGRGRRRAGRSAGTALPAAAVGGDPGRGSPPDSGACGGSPGTIREFGCAGSGRAGAYALTGAPEAWRVDEPGGAA